MGLRNLLILIFSGLAVGLVALVIVFTLFFDHMDWSTNIKSPDSAPVFKQSAPPLASLSNQEDDAAQAPVDETSSFQGVTASAPVSSSPSSSNLASSSSNQSGWSQVGQSLWGGLGALIRVPGEALPKMMRQANPALAKSSAKTPVAPQTLSNIAATSDEADLLSSPESANLNPNLEEQATPNDDVVVVAPSAPVAPPAPVSKKPLNVSPPNPAGGAAASGVWRPRPTYNGVSTQPKASPQPVPAALPKKSLYRVYLGGFSSVPEAQQAAQRYQSQGINAIVRQSGGRISVQLGVFSNPDSARDLADRTGAALQEQ